MADDFSFEIVEHLGIVSEGKGGWTLEFNRVSWAGRDAKFDLRSWSADHKKMSKGITLTQEDISGLKKLLNEKTAF